MSETELKTELNSYYVELRLSSDAYGNAQGHYAHYSKDATLLAVVKDAKEYAERYNYLTNYIKVQLWKVWGEDQLAFEKLLVDWANIYMQYPKMPLQHLFFYAYDPTSVIGDYPLLITATTPYLDGCEWKWRKTITLKGRY